MDSTILVHYGVPGQKWGVRRYQNKDGSLTSEGKRRYSDQQERQARKDAVKNRRNMSDDEIRKRIERLKLEREFKSLTEEDIAPGRKYVTDILKSVGTKTLTAIGAGALMYAGKAATSQQFNWKELGNYVFANPNKKK